MENANAILFYNSKNHFIIYTILFYNTSTSQNSISIKILFFNISLLFLYNCHFFSDSFRRLSNNLFFYSPSPSIATHKNPSAPQPINNHCRATHQQPQPRHLNPSVPKPINNHNPSHRTKNPSHRSTQATDPRHQKPKPRHLNPSTTTTTATAPKTQDRKSVV